MFTKGDIISDRYEIVKSIGEGGMANVYLAVDTILERKVAVKVLRGDLASDDKFVRRFQREALSSSSLSHPNIVEVYDVGEENNCYYIVMEYIDGKTLKDLIKKRGNLTLAETMDIMLQLTDGLFKAHESYIIHRDIKPQNIMLLENGMVKITDFGIALATNNLSFTQTNSVMGSVHYLPPEQASGKGSTVKSDIYSLGVLMFELLTGKVPYKGDTAVEIALKHLKDPFPSIRKINSDIPQSVENIVIKSCAKNPKNRYSNVKEMHDDIETCLKEERKNETKIVFAHQDIEEVEIKKSKIEEKNKEEKEIAKKVEEDDNKLQKIIVMVLSSILLSLMVLFSFLFFILPNLNQIEEIKIPDVSKMSLVEAETILKETGFDVALETKEIYSDYIDKDLVVKTSPAIGRTVKEATTITIYLSLGTEKIILEDYTGEDASKIQGSLETLGLNVIITSTTEVENPEQYEENEIIRQEPLTETSVVKGETITLYVVNKNIYPDMVADKWNEDAATEFAEKYNLTLTVIEEISDELPGTVLYQSRQPGLAIINGASLTIKVAIPEPIVIPEEEEEGAEPPLEE